MRWLGRMVIGSTIIPDSERLTLSTSAAWALGEEGVRGVRAVSSVAEATEGARVVVTATDSRSPVLDEAALEPDLLVSAVGGYRRDMQEVPTAVTRRARIVVDQVEAALREAGDVWIPLEAGAIARESLREIGDLLHEATTEGAGGGPPWPGVTLFKSVGNAVQDLAVASRALERSEALGLGTLVRG